MASLIIAIPVFLWALSGFMHPVMTTVKPRLATQSLVPLDIDSSVLKIPFQSALQQNKISTLHNFRLVHIDTNWFYQVQRKADEVPLYLSTNNGKQLRNGDILYAQYIAKQFLEGQPVPPKKPVQYASLAIEPGAVAEKQTDDNAHDCCDAATACVLLDSKGSRASSPELVTHFDAEYKTINRLLPVYKVGFNRPDGIRIYVETTQDRFAFAMDNKRALFDKIFGLFHTWEWLNGMGSFKYWLMAIATSLAFLTTLMGLWIFFTTKTKKGNHPLVKSRRYHRYVSLTASLFTLLFTFSGGMHAIEKIPAAKIIADTGSAAIPVAGLNLDLHAIESVAGRSVHNVSLAKIDTMIYWRVLSSDPSAHKKTPQVKYINTADGQILLNGEEQYARHLATTFSHHAATAITGAELITKFAGEYGFVNKRLPVWKVGYASNNKERYYVETSTGKAAAYVTDNDLFEGYSFALFHKHHFMDWGGKTTRDISTMIAAALQVAMVVVGLVLYFKWRKKRNAL